MTNPVMEEQGYQKKETPDSTDDDPVEGSWQKSYYDAMIGGDNTKQ